MILGGLRVLDLGEGIAVPFAARLLAEAGADVVKVERPGGDPARELWPAGFATWNRSKRGLVLDLERDSIDELLARVDVVLHGFPAARARALGLDDATLARKFPHLVTGTAPAYPDGHPRADEDLPDSLVQAVEGFFDEQQGNREGPVFVRMPFPSWCAAHLLAAGVLARLVQRERTGTVAGVQTSVFQGALAPAALYWQRSDRLPPGLEGHTLPKIWPDAALSIFECADGEWIQLAGAMGGWLESLPVLETLAVLDKVDLSEVGVRPHNRAEWREVFLAHDSTHWISAFGEADVPCMRIRDLGDCFTEEQSRANGYVVEVDDASVGRCLQVGPPVRTTPACAVSSPAPRLGEHDLDDVLADFGDPRPPLSRSEALPLAGLRALDFGSVVAGPYGAQCLGDLGADVIKVEPLSGDRGRGLTQFAGSNRGKRSLTLDLKAPESREPLRRLIETTDVVLHNMRLGPAARLGIDGPGLRAVNPRVVFSHVSANGQEGPHAAYPGYDPTAQALTGWERANAGPGEPMWLRNSILDVQGGLAATVGALLQLVHRERTGVAADSATSLLACGMTIASEVALPLDGSRLPVDRVDAEQTGLSPTHRILRVRTGWLALAARTAAERARLARLTGGADPAEAFRGWALDDLLPVLREAGVPAVRVTFDQQDAFFDNPVHRSLGVSRTLETRGYGSLDAVGGFWNFGRRGESVPDLGEHTAELLAELREKEVVV